MDINHISLMDLLPVNLKEDSEVVNAAKALDDEINLVTKATSELILFANLDNLPEKVIDLLAWQLHVDFWDNDFDIKIKREMVKNSISWHKRKGTPSVVEEVVSKFLDNAVVRENWEYGGAPYCFKVDTITGPMVSDKTINEIVKAINAVKNTRSHLDGVSFVRRPNQNIYIGGATQQHKNIIIGPPIFKMPDVKNTQYITSLNYSHKGVNVKWQTGMA